MAGQLNLSLRGHRTGLITVSDLVRMVRDTLDANLGEGWVVGEISNARLAPSNHLYFTLKDSRSAINVRDVQIGVPADALQGRRRDGSDRSRPRAGLRTARHAATLRRGDGAARRRRAAGRIRAVEAAARGAKDCSIEPANARCRSCPRRIGIVTAHGGAGLRDMLRILFDRFPSVHVIFRPARVQGDGAAQEIADAIADLNRDGRAEVLIVGRGGGSLEDLWAFNEEVVARAIFRSLIPVISAVGHEVDYTIADFVADLRAPTPTAAAQMVVPSLDELKERVESLGASLASVMERELVRSPRIGRRPRRAHPPSRQHRRRGARSRCRPRGRPRRRGVVANRGRAPQCPRVAPASSQSRRDGARDCACALRGSATILFTAPRRLWKPNAASSARTAGRLDALSPLKVLDRGYSVVINKTQFARRARRGDGQVRRRARYQAGKGRLSARATGRSVCRR